MTIASWIVGRASSAAPSPGLVDAGVAIAGGIGGMSVGKAIRLVALSASLLAVAGGARRAASSPRAARSCADAPPGALGGRLLDARGGAAGRSTTRSRCSPGTRAARIPAHGADLRRR